MALADELMVYLSDLIATESGRESVKQDLTGSQVFHMVGFAYTFD